MQSYNLMHKDIVCGIITLDEVNGRVVDYKDNGAGYSPFLGNADVLKIKKWWEMRTVPSSRETIRDIITKAGCINPETYLAKNLALSMTDSYWICPLGIELSYDQVKFDHFALYNQGKVPYHNATSYDYNASLGGQMEKYWDFNQSIPVLIKECSKFYGQQSINEVFASKIHTLQNNFVPFVKYTAEKISGHGIVSYCDAFTSDSIELLSAYEIIESEKCPNNCSLYDHYINLCVKHGIAREIMQAFMDYQSFTDFIITNVDEHLANFGVLRNTETMKLIGPAPIFDSGNSMFYNSDSIKSYNKAMLLSIPITGFYQKEEKVLAKIQNRNIVKLDLLPSTEEIKDLYIGAGIPEQKANFISENYTKKIELAQEFQHGKTISFYTLKQEENTNRGLNKGGPSLQFIMLCGLPGAGKSKLADKLLQERLSQGKKLIDSKTFYPLSDALHDFESIIDRNKKQEKAEKITNGITIVSANSIRKEIEEENISTNQNFVFYLAEMRVKNALAQNVNVIYDASNLTKENREKFLRLAENAEKELYIVKSNFSPKDILVKQMSFLQQMFDANYPTMQEGWDCIEKYDSLFQEEELGL